MQKMNEKKSLKIQFKAVLESNSYHFLILPNLFLKILVFEATRTYYNA